MQNRHNLFRDLICFRIEKSPTLDLNTPEYLSFIDLFFWTCDLHSTIKVSLGRKKLGLNCCTHLPFLFFGSTITDHNHCISRCLNYSEFTRHVHWRFPVGSTCSTVAMSDMETWELKIQPNELSPSQVTNGQRVEPLLFLWLLFCEVTTNKLLPCRTIKWHVSLEDTWKFFSCLPSSIYYGVLLKWEFFIKMRAACFAPSFLQKRGVMEWGCLQVGSSHFNEKFQLDLR